MTIDLGYLTEVGKRGVVLNYDQDLSCYDEKKQKRLERTLERLQEEADFDHRLRVRYRVHDNGRIMCRPNLLALPPECLWHPGSDLLDVGIAPLETILFCRLRGEEELANEFLSLRGSAKDILSNHFPGASKEDLQYLKRGLFGGLFGKSPDSEQEEKAQLAIYRTWPKLKPPEKTKEARQAFLRKVFSVASKTALAIGKEADKIPFCQTVGFFHGEPLIEFDSYNADMTRDEVEGFLRDLTYNLLQFWNPT